MHAQLLRLFVTGMVFTRIVASLANRWFRGKESPPESTTSAAYLELEKVLRCTCLVDQIAER